MIPALWVSKTGLDAQSVKVGVISNNLANVGTTGYKKSRAVFEDLLYQNVKQPGGETGTDAQSPSGLMLGTGVKIVATQKNFTTGNVQRTDNPLDISISGRGFFQVTRASDGATAYTRDGSFQINSDGNIVTANGEALTAGITIPENATSISISSNGVVTVTQPGQAAQTELGTIQVADFINPAGLEPLGKNQFLETAASGAPRTGDPGSDGLGELTQNTLESSNVNVVEELVNLIETQRAYEMNSKAISTVDGMLEYASQAL